MNGARHFGISQRSYFVMLSDCNINSTYTCRVVTIILEYVGTQCTCHYNTISKRSIYSSFTKLMHKTKIQSCMKNRLDCCHKIANYVHKINACNTGIERPMAITVQIGHGIIKWNVASAIDLILCSSATRSSATHGYVTTVLHPPNNLAKTGPVNPVAVVP